MAHSSGSGLWSLWAAVTSTVPEKQRPKRMPARVAVVVGRDHHEVVPSLLRRDAPDRLRLAPGVVGVGHEAVHRELVLGAAQSVGAPRHDEVRRHAVADELEAAIEAFALAAGEHDDRVGVRREWTTPGTRRAGG